MKFMKRSCTTLLACLLVLTGCSGGGDSQPATDSSGQDRRPPRTPGTTERRKTA